MVDRVRCTHGMLRCLGGDLAIVRSLARALADQHSLYRAFNTMAPCGPTFSSLVQVILRTLKTLHLTPSRCMSAKVSQPGGFGVLTVKAYL